MKKHILWLVVVVLTACGTSQEITKAHVNEEALKHEAFEKVCVLALVSNPDTKGRIEKQVVKHMKKRGIHAVPSHAIAPNQLTSLKSANIQTLDSILDSSACDALFTVSLLDAKSEAKYVRDEYGEKMPNFSYKYYNNYQSYYSYRNAELNSAPLLVEETSYLIESVLYDVEANCYVWSVQSSTLQPSSVKSWVKGYSKLLVEELHHTVGFRK